MKEKDQKRRQYYEHKPVRELKAKISQDGKFWILKDITTHMVPRTYLSTIEANYIKGLNKDEPTQAPKSVE